MKINKRRKFIINIVTVLIFGFAMIFRLPMFVINPDKDLWFTVAEPNIHRLHIIRAYLLLKRGADMSYALSNTGSSLSITLRKREYELLSIMFEHADEYEVKYILDYAERENDLDLSAFVLEQMGTPAKQY